MAESTETTQEYGGIRDIMEAKDVGYEDVLVPEWGNKLYRLRALTGTDADSLVPTEGDLTNFKARLVVRSLVDPKTGKRLFRDDDAVRLGQHSNAVLHRLALRIQQLSGLDQLSQEGTAKNSDATPSAEQPSE